MGDEEGGRGGVCDFSDSDLQSESANLRSRGRRSGIGVE